MGQKSHHIADEHTVCRLNRGVHVREDENSTECYQNKPCNNESKQKRKKQSSVQATNIAEIRKCMISIFLRS